jgi:type VI secretion system secreted protein VgrG
MSKEIQTEISIEGKSVTHFSSIIINQQFNSHHTFQLIVSHEVFEEQGSHSIQSSQEFIGKRITILFGEKSTDDNTFKGVITEVGMQHNQGLWGNIILKGYSPTFLMESGKHNDSYYKKSLDTVVKSITGKMSVHDMKLTIQPAYTKTLDYTCQYKESNFQFINRLATEYGEWFFYNGEELFFGKPSNASKVELLYGEHIEDMAFSMRVIPTKVTHYSYNSSENEVNKTDSPESVDGSNMYMKHALSVSDELFNNPVTQPVEIRTADKEQLDDYAKKEKGVRAASTILLTAHGDNPKVKLGCHVNLKVVQKEIKGKETPAHGEYLVTAVTHHLSGTGEYTHTFEAIPSDISYIPGEIEGPIAETQMAIVKDNDDPAKAGRVRVQMIWQQKKNELTDWIRVLTPDAGSSDAVSKNRGFVFIPEVGDQVLVGFRYNDPNRPFVMGSMFHGKIGSGGGATNKTKSMATRSGNKLELNDEHGSVFLTDKGGANTMMDGAGNITTKAKENSVINVGEGKSVVSMDKEGNLSITGATNITLCVRGSMIEITEKMISISSEKIEMSSGDIQMTGKGNWKGGKIIIN